MKVEAAALATASLLRTKFAPTEPSSSFAEVLADSHRSDQSVTGRLFSFDEVGVLGSERPPQDAPSEPEGAANASSRISTAGALLHGLSARSTAVQDLRAADRTLGEAPLQPADKSFPTAEAAEAATAALAPSLAAPPGVSNAEIAAQAPSSLSATGDVGALTQKPSLLASKPGIVADHFAAGCSEPIDSFDGAAPEAIGEAPQSMAFPKASQLGRSNVASASSEASVIVTGQDGLIQVIAASPGMPPEARVRLRQLADEVSGELGLKLTELSLNGKNVEPAPVYSRSFT